MILLLGFRYFRKFVVVYNCFADHGLTDVADVSLQKEFLFWRSLNGPAIRADKDFESHGGQLMATYL